MSLIAKNISIFNEITNHTIEYYIKNVYIIEKDGKQIKISENLILKEIAVYNNLGQHIFSSTQPKLKIDNLSSGVYFVEIITDKGKTIEKFIIKGN